jgi:hypothetical protein
MKIITKLKTVIPNLRLYHSSNPWLNPPKVLLGRWNIDYCENIINKKLDLSNEDHCGVCNNNIINNIIDNKTHNFTTIDIDNLILFEKI